MMNLVIIYFITLEIRLAGILPCGPWWAIVALMAGSHSQLAAARHLNPALHLA